MKFSIIIPVFNRPNLLKRCLDSLATQTFKDFEVVICDDGSTVDLKPTILNFSDKLIIKYFYISNSGSPAKPRNEAVNLSNGDWLAFLDSDDWWVSNRLELAIKYLTNDIDVFYNRLEIKKEFSKSSKKKRMVGNNLSVNSYYDLLTLGNYIPNSAAIVRRDFFIRIGGFDETQPLIEDYDFWVMSAKEGAKFIFVDACVGYYSVGSDNISAPSTKNIEALNNVFSKQLPNAILSKDALNEMLSFRDYCNGLSAKSLGNCNLAIDFFLNAKNLRLRKQRLKRIVRIFESFLSKFKNSIF
jgi:glycosyltransferase involved in cell wall biosynthesis